MPEREGGQPSGVGTRSPAGLGDPGSAGFGAFSELYLWGQGFMKDPDYCPPWETLTSVHLLWAPSLQWELTCLHPLLPETGSFPEEAVATRHLFP